MQSLLYLFLLTDYTTHPLRNIEDSPLSLYLLAGYDHKVIGVLALATIIGLGFLRPLAAGLRQVYRSSPASTLE